MVGPWQVPVADVAVTASGFQTYSGEAMAMGERTPLAVLDARASVRMAVCEALTNIAAASIENLSDVRLSANWMAAAGHPGEDALLFDAVAAIGLELCPALGITIPVGKDSLSMKTVWQDNGEQKAVTAPLSLIVSAFAPVSDIRTTLTPQLQLQLDQGDSELLLIDLGYGKNRLGGSALAQVYAQTGAIPPDLDDPERLKAFFEVIQNLRRAGLLLAYHDRSDGGLLAAICEMAFASHCGLTLQLDALGDDALAALFSEEAGALIQIAGAQHEQVGQLLADAGLGRCSHRVAVPNDRDQLVIEQHGQIIFAEARITLQRLWSETCYRMQALRDDPQCAREAFDALLDAGDPGLHVELGFAVDDNPAALLIASGARPRVAILREQGVNGQIEMAAAFERAGFAAIDVHMSDIISGRVSLTTFHGLASCGGFSYGDVLGAGEGWAKSVLFNTRARDQFAAFFARDDSFGLGVCNGCQMFSNLHELIAGTEHWPHFIRNRSEQFEARLSLVEIADSPSLFFTGMTGSRLPVVVAHGEGCAQFANDAALQSVQAAGLVALRFVDNYGQITENYPANPNGSPAGITGLTTADGRFTILMPHPERVFRSVQWSWRPPGWGEDSPWLRMFRNARAWLG
jgi:phosphoribosylformylglycinamidine synthase